MLNTVIKGTRTIEEYKMVRDGDGGSDKKCTRKCICRRVMSGEMVPR